MEKDIFISYSSKDKEIVDKIFEDLKKRKIKVWLDRWDIKPGSNIVSEIQKGLDNSSFILAVLTPNSVESNWVEEEWTSQFWDQVNEKKIRVIPAVFGDVPKDKIPIFLKNKSRIDLKNDYAPEIDRLIQFILEERRKAVEDKVLPDLKKIIIDSVSSGGFEKNYTSEIQDIIDKLDFAKGWAPEKYLDFLKKEIDFTLHEIMNEENERKKKYDENPSEIDIYMQFLNSNSHEKVKKLKDKIDYILANTKDLKDAIIECRLELDFYMSKYKKTKK